jgi:hypothetical protein
VLYVSSIAVVASHDHGPDGLHAVADARSTPASSPAPSPASGAASTLLAAPSAVQSSAPAAPTLAGAASVTRVRPHDATTTGSGVVLPAARRALSAVDATPDPASGIGTTALAAYQRAASVIDDADPTCALDWTVLAAIGDVESDHGTYGGSTLSASGVATPAILGPVLDGRHHTALVTDTDAGALDGNAQYDRAIGPMQILPATWLQIAVDGDGDGRRDPQDIDDAALAAAVYLCADGGDLSTPTGARSAVLRYNHSTSYATTVLAAAAAYQQDETATAAVGVTGVIDAQPLGEVTPAHHADAHGHRGHHHAHAVRHGDAAAPHHAQAGTALQAVTPTTPAAHTPTPTGSATLGTAPGKTPSGAPSGAPTAPRTDELCRDAITTAYPDAADDVVDAAVAACVQQLDGRTGDQARAALPDVVAQLPTTVDGLTTPAPSPTDDPSAPTASATADPAAPDSPATTATPETSGAS